MVANRFLRASEILTVMWKGIRLVLWLRVIPKRKGIDFKETFYSVSSKDSFRKIIDLIADYDLELHQMDVKMEFSMATLTKQSTWCN